MTPIAQQAVCRTLLAVTRLHVRLPFIVRIDQRSSATPNIKGLLGVDTFDVLVSQATLRRWRIQIDDGGQGPVLGGDALRVSQFPFRDR